MNLPRLTRRQTNTRQVVVQLVGGKVFQQDRHNWAQRVVHALWFLHIHPAPCIVRCPGPPRVGNECLRANGPRTSRPTEIYHVWPWATTTPDYPPFSQCFVTVCNACKAEPYQVESKRSPSFLAVAVG